MTDSAPFIDALGINYVVLNVRDLAASHEFYVRKLGFAQVGELHRGGAAMRFYACRPGSHHDLALVEVADRPDPPSWSLSGSANAINHFAVALNRPRFLALLKSLQALGVPFAVRGEHGMSHSCYVVDPDGNGIEFLYELPASLWRADVDAALNHFEPIPTEGPDALLDSLDYPQFRRPATDWVPSETRRAQQHHLGALGAA